MLESTALPRLEMLPIELLVPHEECDPRRVEKLARRIGQDGFLRHPPVVTPLPETDRYVVLDGATRTQAFADMGIPHIVAQVISYGDPGVQVSTWHHVVAGMPLDEFEEALMRVTGLKLQPCTLEAARAALAVGEAAAYVVCASGVRKVTNHDHSRLRDIHLLNELAKVYQGHADIFRASNDIWEIQVPYYPGITALVVFPQYSAADILMLARRGEKVPTGITRHAIPNRALFIDIPLSVLERDWTLEQKREWLRGWWMDQMAANAVRFYSESTFLFGQ